MDDKNKSGPLRLLIKENPRGYLKDLGVNIADDVEIVVKENSKDVFYMVMQNRSMTEKEISHIYAASGTASSGSTVASAGSVSTFGSTSSASTTVGTASTAGSASSLSSIGSAGSVSVNS